MTIMPRDALSPTFSAKTMSDGEEYTNYNLMYEMAVMNQDR